MVQILKQPGFGERLGEALGTGLGGGLSGGLQALASQRLQNLAQERTASQFEKAGYPRQWAYFDPRIQAELVKAQERRPGEEAYAESINKLLGTDTSATETKPIAEPTSVTQLPTEVKPKPRLNERQATELAKLGFEKRKREESKLEKQQTHIESQNEPYLKEIRESKPIAQQTQNLAKEMLTLLDTGKVKSGLKGYVPEALQNPESQQFIAKANTLAGLIAASGKGVPTNFKIKLAQISKPNITQSSATQRKLLNDLIKDTQKILLKDEARQAIIDENDGVQPKNIESLIKKRVHQLSKSGQLAIGKTVEELPNAAEYKGAEIEDESTGDVLISDGSNWIKKGQ